MDVIVVVSTKGCLLPPIQVVLGIDALVFLYYDLLLSPLIYKKASGFV